MSDGSKLFVSSEWIAQESMSDIENKGGAWSLKLCLDYSRRPLLPAPGATWDQSSLSLRLRSDQNPDKTAKKDMEM